MDEVVATEVAMGTITSAILTLAATTIQGTSKTPVSSFSCPPLQPVEPWCFSLNQLDLLVVRGSIIPNSPPLCASSNSSTNHIKVTAAAEVVMVAVDRTVTKTAHLATVVDKVEDMAAVVLAETACLTLELIYRSKAGVCNPGIYI